MLGRLYTCFKLLLLWVVIEMRDIERDRREKGGVMDLVDVDEELVLAEGFLDDWYVIERATGGKINSADVEGTASEMLSIAGAIESRGSYGAKRCNVAVSGKFVYLCSPENSVRYTRVPLARADALAADIREKLKDPDNA